MDEIKNDENQLEELEALKAENERLKTKNAKLYKDCVYFAKKIKANEEKETRIHALEKEVEELKAMLEQQNTAPAFENNFAGIQESDEIISSEPIVYTPMPTDPIPQEQAIPKNHHVSQKPSGLRIFVRTVLWIFFILSLLVCLVSGITYLFSTTYADYTVGGYRFATVTNNAMSPQVNKNDVVLIKYTNTFDGIELESLVVTNKDNRSVGKLVGLNVNNGTTAASISDKVSTYTVSENQFIGTVKLTIPQLGKIVSFASQNHYNYLAIIVSATLVFLALIILIPAKKTKSPKFGKDYTVEDFTI